MLTPKPKGWGKFNSLARAVVKADKTAVAEATKARKKALEKKFF